MRQTPRGSRPGTRGPWRRHSSSWCPSPPPRGYRPACKPGGNCPRRRRCSRGRRAAHGPGASGRRRHCACHSGCRISRAQPVFGDVDDGAQTVFQLFLAGSAQPLAQFLNDLGLRPPVDEYHEAKAEAPLVFGVQPVQFRQCFVALLLQRARREPTGVLANPRMGVPIRSVWAAPRASARSGHPSSDRDHRHGPFRRAASTLRGPPRSWSSRSAVGRTRIR